MPKSGLDCKYKTFLLLTKENSMSLLASSKRRVTQTPQVVSSETYFNVTPQTHPSVTPTADKLKVQQEVIGNMRKQCSDLFSSNPAVRSHQLSTEIYHTSQLYGESISLEELADNMKAHDLCLAISATSPDSRSSALAMMDTSHLTKENLDLGYVKLQKGEGGTMVVSFSKGTTAATNNLHYISSIDFHVEPYKGE